jgi:hypothetical protein
MNKQQYKYLSDTEIKYVYKQGGTKDDMRGLTEFQSLLKGG